MTSTTWICLQFGEMWWCASAGFSVGSFWRTSCMPVGCPRTRSRRHCAANPLTACFLPQCSQPCGGGRQFRTVSCRRLNAYAWVDPEPVPQERCDGAAVPATSQACNEWPCDAAFAWEAAEWGPCSAPCGRKGRQTRRLFCRRRADGRFAPRFHCPREHKPPRKRKCNQRKCECPRQAGSFRSGETTWRQS